MIRRLVHHRGLTPLLRLALGLHASLVLAFLALPLVVIAPLGLGSGQFVRFPPEGTSLAHAGLVLASPVWRAALGNSLWIGLATAALATVLGTLAALSVSRAPARLRKLLLVLFLSPLLVPVIALLLGTHLLFASLGLLGSLAGMIAAHTVLALPLVVAVVAANLQGVDPDVERAAASLGAPPAAVFRTVTLRSIRPGIIIGAVLAFLSTTSEVVAPLLLAGEGWRTAALTVFDTLRIGIDPASAVMGTLGLLLAIMTLTLAGFLSRRSATRD